MGRSTLYTPARDREIVRAVWGYPGILEVREGIHAPVELSLLPGWKVILMAAWINVEEEPTGGDLICDIKYSVDPWNTAADEREWNSIFGDDLPTIEAGMIQNEGALTRFATYPEPMELRNIWQPEGPTVKILFRGDITQASAAVGLVLKLDMAIVTDY